MGTLRAKMEQDLAVRGISARTGQNYLRFVVDLARHYGRAPDTLTVVEVETYLVHLRQARPLTRESLAPKGRSLKLAAVCLDLDVVRLGCGVGTAPNNPRYPQGAVKLHDICDQRWESIGGVKACCRHLLPRLA
jgi:hypothetical protein